MGNIDLFHSRRTNYRKCEYWVRDEREQNPPSKWVLYNQSNGRFYAKPVSPKTNQMNVINNVWALDVNHETLETDDEIDIKRGCIVKYNDELWLVENVQSIPHNKESEFSKKVHYKHIMYLTRG